MRSRRPNEAPAIIVLSLVMTALLASWTGCGSGSHTTNSNSTGSGTQSSGSLSGSGGSGAGGAGVGGLNAGPATSTSSSTSTSSGTGADGGSSDADGSVACTPAQKMCNGVCVGSDDPNYGCGPVSCLPCSTYANATAQCTNGSCSLGACDTGYKNCDGNDANGCEVNIGNDPTQCGACGTPCVVPHATPSCTAGVCGIATCDSGWTDCNGKAVDGCETNLPNDPNNCGMCGNICAGQATCQSGQCGLVCPKGTANCPGDPPNVCATNLGTNKNCNFCGDTCNLANSNSQCTQMNGMGVCDLVSCTMPYQNCDMSAPDGCETNTSTDPNNCNSCGNACPFGPHSTATCTGSTCGLACDPGYLDCDGNPTNGCEVNGQTDPANCNTCKNACDMNNATENCVGGVCTIITCASGYQDCNKTPTDGCEANTQTDPNNCGGCGVICKTANGTPACSQGMCTVGSCNAGFSHCPSKPGTDCETSTGTDPNNCGTCGNVCSSNNDTPSCSGGKCGVQCNPGFGDCDNNPANGCESSTSTVGNCGTCGNACVTTNGTPSCSGSPPVCGVASCSMGYANCPGNGNNCLTFIGGSDASNCGACGHVCGSDATNPALHDSGACVGGSCTVGTCDPNYGDCNNSATDGCETALNTIANCGACGHACSTTNGTPACNLVAGSWTCQVASCNSPYLNCPGDGTDCTTNPNTDNGNCGSCGVVCNANTCGGTADHVTGAACIAAKCEVTTCSTGYADYDGTCGDGCECQDSTVSTTCPGGAFALGSIPPLAAAITHTSNMFPATPNAAFYTVTFLGNTDVTNFHPKITITDPLNEFVMEVTSDCSTALTSCNTSGDAASANGVTTWEASYSGVSPPADPASYPVTGSHFEGITVGNNGTVYIKAFRKGAMTSCGNSYTITVTN